jgi:ribosome recycling factor
MDGKTITADLETKMKKTLDVFFQTMAGIRSGRANAGMVENIKVDYYGTMTPIKQLANITIPEPKTILISPWDASALKALEKALLESDLGITPIVDGKAVRLSVPTLTKERREELAKIGHKVSEDGRVALRSLRREGNERLKALEKEKKITEDESFKFQGEVQKLTDRYIQTIDQNLAQKEKELSTI